MSSPRLRRLRLDYERLETRFRDWAAIRITGVTGDPPEQYQVTYNTRGLYSTPAGQILERGQHVVEINLSLAYPRRAPQCKMLTPIFHPNFDEVSVCIGDFWAASEGLDDLIVRIGRMIAYQEYNTKSPLNGLAAKWAAQNAHLLPVDSAELAPPAEDAGPEDAEKLVVHLDGEHEPAGEEWSALYIYREGEQHGPYTREEAERHMADGTLHPEDLAWHVGLTAGVRLATLVSATPPETDAEAAFSQAVVDEIAPTLDAGGPRLSFGTITVGLHPKRTTVGRRPDNNIQAAHSSISSHHAELVETEEGILLRDLGSTNGSRLNGAPVTEAVLKSGDQISFGELDATFLDG